MTRLLIARHGNTFTSNETPRRVGKNSDIPLVTSGMQQGVRLGKYLKQQNLLPDIIYCSQLQRTQQTAQIARDTMQIDVAITSDTRFNEIDYGIDENKTEDAVIARIGHAAIEAWNTDCVVPDGWLVSPDLIRQQWQIFASKIVQEHPHGTVLVVTSNGIARFAPCLLEHETDFNKNHSRKISTGAVCEFEFSNQAWHLRGWNVKPPE